MGQQRESVFFYTFHKCASSLFSGFALKKARGLAHVDYASEIYNDTLQGDVRIESRGKLYGPIRLTVDPDSPVHARLVKPLSQPDWIKNRKAVFLIRDPRDILVSQYYSFGWSHGLSKNKIIRERQVAFREKIQNVSIDEYALEASAHLQQAYSQLSRLHDFCDNSVLIKFEDMVNRWNVFEEGLNRLLDFDRGDLDEIYRRSRPRTKEDTASHRRHGGSGAYREKFTQETIALLNTQFAEHLEKYDYCDDSRSPS